MREYLESEMSIKFNTFNSGNENKDLLESDYLYKSSNKHQHDQQHQPECEDIKSI